MSLYNALFGVEPTAGVALVMLGIKASYVPRLRDAYFTFTDEEQTDPAIVILTRTGGGNRDYYESLPQHKTNYAGEDYSGPFNSDLRKITGFRYDKDVDFDSTYAEFYFDVPEVERQTIIGFLNKTGKPMTFAEKFETALNALKSQGAK
jgi:hypothetical protein